MANSMELNQVRLPVGMQSDDILSLYDQMQHRVGAVLAPAAGGSKKKHALGAEGVALPADVKPSSFSISRGERAPLPKLTLGHILQFVVGERSEP